jgi:hypothetical protein
MNASPPLVLNRVRHPSKCWRNRLCLLHHRASHAILWGSLLPRVREGNLVRFSSAHLPRSASLHRQLMSQTRTKIDDVKKMSQAILCRCRGPIRHSLLQYKVYFHYLICALLPLGRHRLGDKALVAREVTLSRIAKQAKMKARHFGRYYSAKFMDLHFHQSTRNLSWYRGELNPMRQDRSVPLASFS